MNRGTNENYEVNRYILKPGPRFTKNLKSDRNRKYISGTKMRFTKKL